MNPEDTAKHRTTIFDMYKNKPKNMFCEKKDLTNEASVEHFFIMPLLNDLGYRNKNIKPKNSIETFSLAKGSKKYNYKPDFVLTKSTPLLVIDAKHPHEKLSGYSEQCMFYCLKLNRMRRPGSNAVRYFVLSNGMKTELYSTDKDEPILTLDFEDFHVGSPKYEELRSYISFQNIDKPVDTNNQKHVIFKKIDKEDAQRLFSKCHDQIRKKDKMSPESAFMEFTKIICVKLYHDRKLHDGYGIGGQNMKIPESVNTFSVRWIKERENESRSPISDTLYTQLLRDIEDDMLKNNKKRMFSTHDKIDLKPSTIKKIVKMLESYDLYGIDDDLNGRLFETFLNSTMRGKALGQFFTPRSIVKLAVRLADIRVSERYTDKVLDGCCGTGGFLIEALSHMKERVSKNSSVSPKTALEMNNTITRDSLFGIDAAKTPMLARIARINMYLHGDGGSHIYYADGLDKKLLIDEHESTGIKADMQDLERSMNAVLQEGGFDVILTNPPFSMQYDIQEDSERRILEQYEISNNDYTHNEVQKREYRNSVKSGILFIERYLGLLKPNGKLITVIDEALLSSPVFEYFRHFLRKYFIIKAVISLHGDAFRMSKARVKTSLIYLVKKANIDDIQPSVFMYPSVKLGVDDLPISARKDMIRIAREEANLEINTIIGEFQKYQNGQPCKWAIDSNKIMDRLDVKHVVYCKGRYVAQWMKKGYCVDKLNALANIREKHIRPTGNRDRKFNIMELTYSGKCRHADFKLGKHIHKPKIQRVSKGNLVISCYNGFHGAVGFVSDAFDGHYVTNEYVVLQPQSDDLGIYLWGVLRTTELRCEFMAVAVGTGRQHITWKQIRDVSIPMLLKDSMNSVVDNIKSLWQMEQQIENGFGSLTDTFNEAFDVESEDSKSRFESTRPPR